MLGPNETGFFPYTPGTNLLYGLAEAIDMLREEGLEHVFRRHDRHAEATRRAVRAWGLEVWCRRPDEYSSSLTAVRVPEGHSADDLRRTILEVFDMSLGNGLGRLADSVFRIGHLGDFNDLMLAGTLSGIEMGLDLAGVPHERGGVDAALAFLTEAASRDAAARAGPSAKRTAEIPAGVLGVARVRHRSQLHPETPGSPARLRREIEGEVWFDAASRG